MCLSALADLVVKNQIITVNNNQFGALHFINAPYKIGDRHTAVIALVKNELFLDRRELCYAVLRTAKS